MNPALDLRPAKGGEGRAGVFAPYNLPKTEAEVSAHESLQEEKVNYCAFVHTAVN